MGQKICTTRVVGCVAYIGPTLSSAVCFSLRERAQVYIGERVLRRGVNTHGCCFAADDNKLVNVSAETRLPCFPGALPIQLAPLPSRGELEELNRNVTSMRTSSCRAASQPGLRKRRGGEATAVLEPGRVRLIDLAKAERQRVVGLGPASNSGFILSRAIDPLCQRLVELARTTTAQSTDPSFISHKPTVKTTPRNCTEARVVSE